MNRAVVTVIAGGALALLAAAAALLPLAASAGPTNGAALPATPRPVAPASFNPQVPPSAAIPQRVGYWGAPAAGDTYQYYATLGVEVQFDAPVTVTGAPYLELLVGSAVKKAAYHEGTGTATLRFQYRVADGDADTDGFSVNGVAALKLNGGAIKSVASPSVNAATAFPATVALPTNDARHKVSGVNSVPKFGAATVAAQVYTLGQLIPALDLPAASDGNGALTYSLNQTTNKPPCGGASGASGVSGGSGSSGIAVSPWMRYYAPGTTYDGAVVGGGGKIAPNGDTKSKATLAATCFELYAVDADGDDYATDRGVLSFSVAVLADYDSDDDGLIDVGSLAQLDAIRYDLNGNGAADNDADKAKYAAAFPNPINDGMGCPLADHDANAATPNIPVCAGYELTKDLDFDTDEDGATYSVSTTGAATGDAGDTYYNGGQGWTPIGGGFTATFDGNHKTISNLFINATDTRNLGLFNAIANSGAVRNLGLLKVSVNRTGNGGVTGSLVGDNQGTVVNCYATGSVATVSASGGGLFTTGGLSGYLRAGGTISSSYADVAVSAKGITAATGRSRIGGLVGRASRAGSAILASYATGPVAGGDYGRAGALVGTISNGVTAGAITASYATGVVTAGANGIAGNLTAISSEGVAVNSYYWNLAQSASADGIGKTLRELQSPTGYASGGSYASWNVDVDNADGDNNLTTGGDDPWDFGQSRQLPVLKYDGMEPAKQRQTSIESDHWNAPVVGEPVTAGLNVTDATGITWQWQSSADGWTWTNIAGATAASYVPAAADAAGGGKFLRARVTFTAAEQSQTLATLHTAKVIAASTATAARTTAAAPMVGLKLRYQLVGVTAADRTNWRWQRCDDAAMTTNCKLLAQSNPSADAHTEYTPAAGTGTDTDTDVGKYLRAYVYYADSGNSNAWTRAQTPVLGPVIAAPVVAPAPTAAPTMPTTTP